MIIIVLNEYRNAVNSGLHVDPKTSLFMARPHVSESRDGTGRNAARLRSGRYQT